MIVRMRIKDAIQLSIEKERQYYKNIERPLKIPRHIACMPVNDEQNIIKLYSEGNSYDDISKITGYHKGTIGVHIRKYKKMWNCNFRKGRIPSINISELVTA